MKTLVIKLFKQRSFKCFYFILLFTALSFISNLVSADTLGTPSYLIDITRSCDEGEVQCDKIHYHGTNKDTGQPIQLDGSTLHSICSDGITPCRFLGYQFKNGDVAYFVYGNGRLVVEQKG